MKKHSEGPQTERFRFTDFLSLYIDGASRGNPGESGVGVVIKGSNGRNIEEVSKYIGVTTNNRAEYTALLEGLEAVARLKKKEPRLKKIGLRIFADSELLVKQIKGEYKVRDSNLKAFYQKVLVLLRECKELDVRHISREYNKEADKLANKAIDSIGHR